MVKLGGKVLIRERSTLLADISTVSSCRVMTATSTDDKIWAFLRMEMNADNAFLRNVPLDLPVNADVPSALSFLKQLKDFHKV